MFNNNGIFTDNFIVSRINNNLFTNIYGPNISTTPLSPTIPISNICFPGYTLIDTNLGKIAIEKINPDIHTIRNKKIVTVTKTITQDKYLVCFEQGSLGMNIPSEKTVISKNHLIFYKGHMIKAKEFIKIINNGKVRKMKYTGEILYNILLENYDKMVVNNLICETLHPINSIAVLYTELKNFNDEEKKYLINCFNEHVVRNNVFTCKR